jgi:hypothetical protein
MSQVEEPDDDERDRDGEFEREAEPRWNHDVKDDDRGTNREQRERMSETPHHTEPRRRQDATRPRGDGGDGDHVIRIGGMSDTQGKAEAEEGQQVHEWVSRVKSGSARGVARVANGPAL